MTRLDKDCTLFQTSDVTFTALSSSVGQTAGAAGERWHASVMAVETLASEMLRAVKQRPQQPRTNTNTALFPVIKALSSTVCLACRESPLYTHILQS